MIPLSEIDFIGHNLTRPECVLAHASGNLFASDWTGTGGVSLTTPSGKSSRLLATGLDFDLRPNGIALEQTGSFLLAHLGDTAGGIYRLFPDGSVETVLDTLDGEPLPPTNFVTLDRQGSLWITVSTRLCPRADDYRPTANSGFIVRHEPETARTDIVADGLGYTNECVFNADASILYVHETFARRLSSFELDESGNLGNYRIISEFESGCFPDGMALDTDGDIYSVSIVSNRLIKTHPESGKHQILFEDSDQAYLSNVEHAWQNHTMGRAHLDNIVSQKLKSLSNIAFGGADLDVAYFGCLLGNSIARVKTSTTGLEPLHWHADIDATLSSSAWIDT